MPNADDNNDNQEKTNNDNPYGEKNGGMHMKNLTTTSINNTKDAFYYINYGKSLRRTSSTKLNLSSIYMYTHLKY